MVVQQILLTKTSDMSLSMKDPTPGSTYTFSVVAIVDGQTSDSISTSVEIPETIDTEIIQEPGTITRSRINQVQKSN